MPISRSVTVVAALAGLALLAGPGAAKAGDRPPIDVQVLAISDFHGYLSPPADAANGSIEAPGGGRLTVGGAAYLATHLDAAAAGRPNSIRVANGDSFTGWQWEVTMARDEPTIELLDHLGIEASAVGNHELDVSLEFLRDHVMGGECFGRVGVDMCFERSDGAPFSAVDFPFLAANLHDASSGDRPFASTYVRDVVGPGNQVAQVGFIGVTTPAVERIFASYQVGRLVAEEMTQAVDEAAAELHRDGVDAIVVLAHDGAETSGTYDECGDATGPVVDLAREASPLVDVVVGGHWHTAFSCSVTDPAGRPRAVVSPGHHGQVFADLSFRVNPGTGEIVRESVSAVNVPVTRNVTPDPEVADLVEHWVGTGGELWARPLATVTENIPNVPDALGQSPARNLVADAYRDIGSSLGEPADLALVEPYQVRNGVSYARGTNPQDADGTVLYGEGWVVQGRASSVVTLEITGADLLDALEQQWREDPDVSYLPLSLSAGARLTIDAERDAGSRVVELMLDGVPIDQAARYRVAMSSRLALGMDGFTVLASGTDPVRSDMDYFAFTAWMESQGTLSAPATDRVVELSGGA
ncbi:5'-Nucleotidase domain protein [Beutenbergia cavernae DSM 12333]|uniref:5'-Nucleotidase domain protein n=1 Tax=Beutenbergia cavernae (strain ATCC BAA-8 / DSM 12333 / CCUG 43141 / JCM 11478 / NBRC 16432 / NCIMB 13614 / HKI 0122) TaxID=471853 RepID=C5C2N3_BEUC1|nr:bifunctional metallophosphatase/5'-nucleotidase [Beutenbergia cavernae]ACQ79719.1 5'-Nucleotidase domain protein [Beutenbergia cavernae DSM 12333]